MTLVIDTDLDLTLETNTLLLIDLFQYQEFLDTLDHAHATKHITVRPQTSNDTINFEVHMYHHTEMALFDHLFGSSDSNFQRSSNLNVSYTLKNSLEKFSLFYRN